MPTKIQIEMNMRAELDKPKQTILSSNLDEIAFGFKVKLGREDSQDVMSDFHHLVGKRLDIRLLECIETDDENQLDLFPNRFANLDRERLIMALEEFEAVARTMQRLAFQATATQSVYCITIMDMEELLAEVEGALNMTGADHYKMPDPEKKPESFCLYRRLEGGGVEAESFENKPKVLGDAFRAGWSNNHPDHEDAKTTDAQEATDDTEPPEADELYQAAKELIVEAQTASVSMLQREYKIGYNRAARLMDDLESGGVVGPSVAGTTREILIALSTDAA